jgi:phytoene desaturase
MRVKKSVTVIGSGFSGLAAASVLANNGLSVTVLEKNEDIGGRARAFSASGYTFDMGPSWYWMPDIFEKYFSQFGKTPQDFYELKLLDPGFVIFFGKDDVMQIPASMDKIRELFDKEEENGAAKLDKFLKEAHLKYKLAVDDLMYLPSQSLFEYVNLTILRNLPNLDVYNSFRSHVRKYFSSPRLLKLIEFPVLFLGATSREIPALYSLMNYAAFNLGTWYPMGGFSSVTTGMMKLATDLGVDFKTADPVRHISISNDEAIQVETERHSYLTSGIIGSSDYCHTELLLEPEYRNYNSAYWGKKIFAPSCLLFYIGVKKRIKNLHHHNLFFMEDMDVMADDIYKNPKWPEAPLFYVCCPSKTDDSVAPAGHENMFILMPLAPGINDEEAIREEYFHKILDKVQLLTGETFKDDIDYRRSYCVSDFISDYNAYKGNAYGLANTLKQTAFMRPSIRNKKVKNMFYAGHITVPGPGVPPAIVSGQIAARQLIKKLKK